MLPPDTRCKYVTRKAIVRSVNLVITRTKDLRRRKGMYMIYDDVSKQDTVIHIQDSGHRYAPLSFISDFHAISRPRKGFSPPVVYAKYPNFYVLDQNIPPVCESPLLPWYYVDDCRLAYTTDLTLTRVPRRIIHGDTLTPALFLPSYQCVVEAYRLALQETQRVIRNEGKIKAKGTDLEAIRHLSTMYRSHLTELVRSVSARQVAPGKLRSMAKVSLSGGMNGDKYRHTSLKEDTTSGYCSVCREEYSHYAKHIASEAHKCRYHAALQEDGLLDRLVAFSSQLKRRK
eukprot:gnl/Carplike_NY0171/2202_a2969_810.p1 GENE.gnl/Carplike_NY0171/2202_a2969_810~~gnl/Carplike_NY0171/2202_a2969_810.p1  ORF type:complete len:337 (-),score=21.99 gnl/Carplike_NY0171/2202_a2969_810:159-1019(-)